MTDFDEIIDRHNTWTEKYDDLQQMFGRDDLLPLWVADMDFRTPDFIVDALKKRLEHPILSYPVVNPDFYPSISAWLRRIHGWEVDPSDIRYMPGLVKALSFILNYFLEPGDTVVYQPPVYHRFAQIPPTNGMPSVKNPLLPVMDNDGFLDHYEMDLDGLEKTIVDSKAKAMILCNPHNPSGRCWDKETLLAVAEITSRHKVLVISDEINAETIFHGGRHIPYASVCPEAAANSVTMMAPSKTFNIAGIVASYIVVQEPSLRDAFYKWLDDNTFDLPSIFSIIAVQASYTDEGWAWRSEMMAYVEENIRFVEEYLRTEFPLIRAVNPQAAPTLWLDCHKLGLSHEELMDLLVNKAGVAFNNGTQFGKEGEQFLRMNVAGPRSVIEEALTKFKNAACQLQSSTLQSQRPPLPNTFSTSSS